MTRRIDALRRFLLPCITPHPTSPTPPPQTHHKKRLSTSLRDDIPENTPQDPTKIQSCTSPSSAASSAATSPTAAPNPPRNSRTMVIGTIFGHRRGGHVWFCVQQNRLSTKPSLLLELSIPTSTLIREMQCGLVRIALEFNASGVDSELGSCSLHSVPVWTMFCNGKKVGFAVRRRANEKYRAVLKSMQNVTVGAGVFPCGFGFGSGSGTGSEEMMYMRANYEFVVGSADSESFHLINPDDGPGQELSVFLLRTR